MEKKKVTSYFFIFPMKMVLKHFLNNLLINTLKAFVNWTFILINMKMSCLMITNYQ